LRTTHAPIRKQHHENPEEPPDGGQVATEKPLGAGAAQLIATVQAGATVAAADIIVDNDEYSNQEVRQCKHDFSA